MSRGAAFACFIDNNRKAFETVRHNLEQTGLSDRADVIFGDAFAFFKNLPAKKYDYVYIAPPQYKKVWSKALEAVDANIEFLAPDGWVIVQINPIEYSDIGLLNLILFDQRKYGDTLLVFYRSID